MGLSQWLSVLLICGLGAAMPGPSLGVVVQNTLRGGFGQGCVTAVAHACGVAVYAVLTVTGLAVVLKTLPSVYAGVQITGALFLIYLAIKTLLASSSPSSAVAAEQSAAKSAGDGFLIAFLNPKLLIFFTALFSQFVEADSSLLAKAILTLTAVLVDGFWYCLVAFVITRKTFKGRFSSDSVWLPRVFAAILMALGLRLISQHF